MVLFIDEALSWFGMAMTLTTEVIRGKAFSAALSLPCLAEAFRWTCFPAAEPSLSCDLDPGIPLDGREPSAPLFSVGDSGERFLFLS